MTPLNTCLPKGIILKLWSMWKSRLSVSDKHHCHNSTSISCRALLRVMHRVSWSV
ncbi:Uncharacterised protein [Vibrio cholerae]|nr:Uncharacterised protein [Vibrio cholerae]